MSVTAKPPLREEAHTPIERIIRDPEFAKRLTSAADLHPHCPPLHRGRLSWVKDSFAKQGEDISIETVRKWFAGETKPHPNKGRLLAQIFEVDAAWLQMGHDSKLDVRQRKVRNAVADGAVNFVAGLIQMDGAFPAFPEEDDKKAKNVDLHAIIKGAKYDFHIALGDVQGRQYSFVVPTDVDNIVVLGLIRDGFSAEIYEITPEILAMYGKRHGGSIEVIVAPSKLRKIETFTNRL